MKTKFTFVLWLVSFYCVSQNSGFLLAFEPGISWLSIQNVETTGNKAGFEFGAVIGKDFKWGEKFALGVELAYHQSKAEFRNKGYFTAIPEIFYNFRHHITLQSLELPLLLKMTSHTKSTQGIHLVAGAGLSYMLNTHRQIDLIQTDMNKPGVEEITTVEHGNTEVESKQGNKTGFAGILGMGKDFKIGGLILYTEVRYQFDLNNWKYETVDDPLNTYIEMKRNGVLCLLGIRF